MPESAPAILFVCLGNICRSPLAEAALRARLAKTGLNWAVDSAGTSATHAGEPPDRRAQAIALQHGADISMLRARAVERDDFYRFTHIFALDANNLATLRRQAPGDATAALSLLLDAVEGSEGQSVPDPYYGDASGFSTTWAQVDRAARALIDRLANGSAAMAGQR